MSSQVGAVLLLSLLGFGVTARVTHFVNDDYLFAPVRAAITGRWGPESKVAYLIECAWCASIWIAGVVAALVVTLEPDVWFGVHPALAGVGLWLTWSYLYGLIASTVDA